MDTKLQLVPDPRNAPPHDAQDDAGVIPFVVLPRGERKRRLRRLQRMRRQRSSAETPGQLAGLVRDERGAVTAEYSVMELLGN